MYFRSFFLFSVLKWQTPLSCTYGSCDIHGVRTTKVRDVTMMYCKERYMKNVPVFVAYHPHTKETIWKLLFAVCIWKFTFAFLTRVWFFPPDRSFPTWYCNQRRSEWVFVRQWIWLWYYSMTRNCFIIIYAQCLEYILCLKLMSKKINKSWWCRISRLQFVINFWREAGHSWVTHLLLWDALVFGVILHVPFLRIHHIYVMYFTSFTSCNIIL